MAFGRLYRLFPIRPHAKRGPALPPQNLHFQSKVFVYCWREAHCIFSAWDPLPSKTIEKINKLRRFLTPSIILIRSLIVTMAIVFRQCVAWVFFNRRRDDKVLKLFSVLITNVLHVAGQFSIVATWYGSIDITSGSRPRFSRKVSVSVSKFEPGLGLGGYGLDYDSD